VDAARPGLCALVTAEKGAKDSFGEAKAEALTSKSYLTAALACSPTILFTWTGANTLPVLL